ncbi:CoA pyrophosphatase [Desulfobacterales bacterium HSG16]|nr:CoA pyrophosphatase [Desulfobacterales bacterium HSG16]
MRIDYSCFKQAIDTATLPDIPKGAWFAPTSVFLLFFEREGATNILAIQKTDTEGYPWRNQVALPGGHVDETDADRLSAAFRELEEEMNISNDQVELIGSMGHFQTINQKDIEVFTGVWNQKGKILYDKTEIARVLEISLSSLFITHHAKKFHGRMPGIAELVYPVDNTVVWGATAKIFHYLIELIYPAVNNGKTGTC